MWDSREWLPANGWDTSWDFWRGHTLKACAVIAARQVSTLILVDRKALADQ